MKPALVASVFSAFIGLSSIGYVWKKNQNRELLKEIDTKRQELAGLQETHDELEKEYDRQINPAELEKRVQQFGLDLRPTDVNRIVSLREPAVDDSLKDARQQYAKSPVN